jgi:hypothetical protein
VFDALLTRDAKAEILHLLRAGNRTEEAAHLVEGQKRFERFRARHRQPDALQVAMDGDTFRSKVGNCGCQGYLPDEWDLVHSVFAVFELPCQCSCRF